MMYRKPNVKSSRVRKKTTRIMNRTAMLQFKKEYPEHKNITLTQFNAILKKFNSNIVDTIVDYRNGVNLPELIGQVIILSFPRSSKKIVDYGESNKTGVLTYKRNWDTDDRICKIVYYTGQHSVRYSHLWGFTPTKNFKKRVSDSFKKLWAKYIYIDNKSVSIGSVLK
tara:strand:+ start:34 stop:537 length:504 start_codon:yes stop_codon:yes gene_type:complete